MVILRANKVINVKIKEKLNVGIKVLYIVVKMPTKLPAHNIYIFDEHLIVYISNAFFRHNNYQRRKNEPTLTHTARKVKVSINLN